MRHLVKTYLTKFQWSPQPAAAALVQELLDEFLRRCPDAAKFADRLHRETGTRIVDWIAAITAYDSPEMRRRLENANFRIAQDESTDETRTWIHSAGLFPRIQTVAEPSNIFLWMEVESIADFAFAHELTPGEDWDTNPTSNWRAIPFLECDEGTLFVVERHGTQVVDPSVSKFEIDDRRADRVLWVQEWFRLRARRFGEDAAGGFKFTDELVRAALKELRDRDRAADLFFAAEREYWMSRNRAAQIQYARQQKLGLGWANHDHHTYRSSREHFADLIAVFEKLGLVCRERFYAGREAGWGAQVMEQPNAGIVVFADVDLSPDEVAGDFAHEKLPPRKELGTVGLWCALHGESFLEAGMHHLECQFDFNAAREQLRACGINTMKPFTDLPHLKQAFTEGEVWPVDPRKIEALLAAGSITPDHAEKFRREGAIGSHLEILQRDDGYKGFNQTGINEIILATDPRKTHTTSAISA
jgi:hypothetical protein